MRRNLDLEKQDMRVNRGSRLKMDPPLRRWSAKVMEQSNALDLEKGVFTKNSSLAIARSLKRSAENSNRRKSSPFRSAMSMLSFHINRSGKSLKSSRRSILEHAKDDLRRLYGRKVK